VSNIVRIFVVLAIVLVAVAPVMAQPAVPAGPTPVVTTEAPWSLINLSSTFGTGLVVIGAAYGISKLAASAYDGMSRQPEVAGNIQTAMIIAAALIEGFTFFALIICMGGNK